MCYEIPFLIEEWFTFQNQTELNQTFDILRFNSDNFDRFLTGDEDLKVLANSIEGKTSESREYCTCQGR